jgi:hypothetical protein
MPSRPSGSLGPFPTLQSSLSAPVERFRHVESIQNLIRPKKSAGNVDDEPNSRKTGLPAPTYLATSHQVLLFILTIHGQPYLETGDGRAVAMKLPEPDEQSKGRNEGGREGGKEEEVYVCERELYIEIDREIEIDR